jgi:Domain of unknown function (DUF4411)
VASPYWLDAGVLIEAKNGLYAFELVPKFWTFIETELVSGAVRMPKIAFDEICAGNDDLAKWCKARKNVGHFCCKADKDVQNAMKTVANYVASNNKPHRAAEFLKGADGWIIAHAIATGGFVVTEETKGGYKSKVKIPDVSKALNCPWKATHQMCKELKAQF